MKLDVKLLKIPTILTLITLGNINPVFGQIIPDNTLPVNSQVTPGCTNCTINGGTNYGNNLFHSFEQFSIPTGGQAHFNNAESIANIFSRVTGLSISTINGLISANGIANLYLINPQGIVFGPNARIDVGGAFVASSASNLNFGNGLEFSAINPDAPPVLTINLTPGLQYGGTPPGATVSNEGVLAVKPGQNLTLAGETVLNSGTLKAPGGTIQVLGDYVGLMDNAVLDVSSATGGGNVLVGGDFGGQGTVPNAKETFIGSNVIINADGIGNADGGNVAVWSDKNTNFQGTITARGGILGGDGGFIETSGKENLTITGTVNANATNGNAGTWLIDPTDMVIDGPMANSISNSLQSNDVIISTNSEGNDEGNITQEVGANIEWDSGNDLTLNADNNIDLNASIKAENGGNITFNAMDTITLMGSIESFLRGQGNSGDVKITTGTLNVLNGAMINSSIVEDGSENSKAGNIIINATNLVKFEGETGNGAPSSAISEVGSEDNPNVIGNGGNIFITTGSLEVTNAVLTTSTFGQGNAGSISINAANWVRFDGEAGRETVSGAFSNVNSGALGNAGIVSITTKGSLEVTNNAQLGTSSQGTGNAGSIIIDATNLVKFEGGNSRVLSEVGSADNPNIEGDAGGISITTGSLEVLNGAILGTSNFGIGDAGSITIEANDSVKFDRGGQAFSNVNNQGEAGNISITTGSLEILNGGQLNTNTQGTGNAGSIIIDATNLVKFEGGNSRVLSEVGSADNPNIEGDAGGISITTGSLEVLNGAILGTSTFGIGDAGSITIKANDSVKFDRGQAFSNVNNVNNDGQAGGISITTGSLEVLNGGQLNTNTAGIADGGNIIIQANDLVKFEGERDNGAFSVALSEVGPEAIGEGGTISITTDSLEVTNAVIASSTGGRGDGGDVIINARDQVKFNGEADSTATGAFSEVNSGAEANAGDVSITAETLEVTNNAKISTETKSKGDAGNVKITATDSVRFDGQSSEASSKVGENAEGNAGNIEITTRSLSLINNSQITVETSGQGNAGTVEIKNADSVSVTNSLISSQSNSAADAGDVTINAEGNPANSVILEGRTISEDGESILGGLSVQADENGGNAGSIVVNTRQLNVKQGAQISATNISSESESINLQGIDTLEVTNGGQITASTQTGTAGNVTVNDNDLPANTVEIRGNNSRLAAEATEENGNAGGVTINTETLTVSDGATVSAENVSGTSGNIAITGLTANTLNLLDGGSITASTDTGTAGNLTVNPDENPITINISGENSRLAVEATEEGGIAGSLTVNAEHMNITDGGAVTVSSPQGQAGNLTINTTRNLRLNQGSITAETGLEGGSGANIFLNVGENLFLSNQSLISANANAGADGGNVTINARFVIADFPSIPNGSDIIANAVDGDGGRIAITADGIFGIEFREFLTFLNDITASSETGAAGIVTLDTPNVDPSRGITQLAQPIDANNQIVRACIPTEQGTAGEFTVTGRGGIPSRPSDVLSGDTVVEDLGNLVPPSSTPEPSEEILNQTPRQKAPLVEAEAWIVADNGDIIFTSQQSSDNVKLAEQTSLTC